MSLLIWCLTIIDTYCFECVLEIVVFVEVFRLLEFVSLSALRHTTIGFALVAPIQRAVRGAPFLDVRLPQTDVRMEIKVERPTADEAETNTQGWRPWGHPPQPTPVRRH